MVRTQARLVEAAGDLEGPIETVRGRVLKSRHHIAKVEGPRRNHRLDDFFRPILAGLFAFGVFDGGRRSPLPIKAVNAISLLRRRVRHRLDMSTCFADA